jgi:lipoprotein-anchoring transpeptidase ErfK/SrfK
MAAPFSRRDFLKVSSAGLLGSFLADLRLERVVAAATPRQGRSTFSGVELLAEPSHKSRNIYAFRRDEILEINGEVSGELGYGNPFNSTWYQVNDGYVYSGAIQLVNTVHQRPIFDIPETGVLGEITVPFSDTRRANTVFADRSYRIYHSTTHWVTGAIVNRDEKSIWYRIFDRQSRETLYVPAHEMRIIPDAELAPFSPAVPTDKKRIYVDLANQMVAAFEGETMVFSARCASGAKGTGTPLGEYRTYHKGPSIHMTNQGDGSENTYHLPGVPWVSFFTGTGVAFHGTYWHNDYGRPSSRGCVNLTPDDAKFIYLWSSPQVPIGTPYLSRPGEGTQVQVVLSSS